MARYQKYDVSTKVALVEEYIVQIAISFGR